MTQTQSERKRIVAKFGGTSMADEKAMQRSAQIAAQRQASIVVVSATSGTTNQLLELADAATSGDEKKATDLYKAIEQRHFELAKKLEVNQQTESELASILGELDTLTRGVLLLRDCQPKTRDSIVSIGERMSSLLFTTCLAKNTQDSVSCLDVRTVMATDARHTNARPDFERIESNCHEHLCDRLSSTVFVTQGFMGRAPSGATTTLGRGGSDYSAALLAWGVDADTLEIWTDVAGIATTDPRICPDARVIEQISFKEAAELAVFGAKILHPTTLAPAGQKSIPVFVGSSFAPNDGGTWIVPEIDNANTPLVRALAMRKNQTLLTLTTPKMLQTHGFLYRIFEIFNDHQISVDAITTSEISVALTLEQGDAQNRQYIDALIEDLQELAEVSIEPNVELVSLIGNRINHTPGLGEKIFRALGDINVRMICHGASRHNFCFIVEQDQGAQAITRLHRHFITNESQLHPTPSTQEVRV